MTKKQIDDLLYVDASPQQAKAAEQIELGRRQMCLVGPKQPSEPQRLAILLRRSEFGPLGCSFGIALQELADQTAEMIQSQRMGSVRVHKPGEVTVAAPNAVAAQQGHRRGQVKPFNRKR